MKNQAFLQLMHNLKAGDVDAMHASAVGASTIGAHIIFTVFGLIEPYTP